jgi:hypothetical protein
MWLPHASDAEDRLTESITRFVAIGVMGAAAEGLQGNRRSEGRRGGRDGADIDDEDNYFDEYDDAGGAGGVCGGIGRGSDGCRKNCTRCLVSEGWLCQSELTEGNDRRDGSDNDSTVDSKQRTQALDHRENISFILESLRELSSSSSSSFNSVSSQEVLQVIANELLQPDVIARCAAKLKKLSDSLN